MSAAVNPFATIDYLGEPIVIKRGYQLCGLLMVCEQAASSLDDIGDGPYRDKVTSSLSNTLELAAEIAGDLLVALELAQPRRMVGGERNG